MELSSEARTLRGHSVIAGYAVNEVGNVSGTASNSKALKS